MADFVTAKAAKLDGAIFSGYNHGDILQVLVEIYGSDEMEEAVDAGRLIFGFVRIDREERHYGPDGTGCEYFVIAMSIVEPRFHGLDHYEVSSGTYSSMP